MQRFVVQSLGRRLSQGCAHRHEFVLGRGSGKKVWLVWCRVRTFALEAGLD
jgi:hypothetical protein